MNFKIRNPLLDAAFWAAVVPLLILVGPQEVYERASENPELIIPIVAWIGGNTALRRKAIGAELARGGE